MSEETEKMDVAKKLRGIYSLAVTMQNSIEKLVGENFMSEMQQIDDEESRLLLKAVKEGELDDGSLDAKQEKLKPWIEKVVKKDGEEDGK